MIQLTQESEQYIKDTLSEYSEVDVLPNVLPNRTIIHLYPTSDTVTKSGELEGFIDSLFVDVYIYMPNTMTYKIIENRDEIDIRLPSRVRIFKDGSTMIIIDHSIQIDVFQSLTIKAVD